MVKKAMKFDPKVLLSAPRRSAGVPNASGTKVLYTTTAYSFGTHKKTIELRVLDVESGESHELATNDEISDLNWLDEDEFACLQAEKDSTTSLYVASVSKVIEGPELGESHYVAGKIDAPAGGLKVKKLDGGDFAVVLSALASSDGSLFNPEKATKVHSTGKLYTGLFVRHWDTYESKKKNALWYGKLSKQTSGKYQLGSITNALEGAGLESPIQPFGGTDCFDLSKERIVCVAKDPGLNPALNTKCNVYLLEIADWNGGKVKNLTQVQIPGFEGASSCPCFSPNGSSLVFLSMKKGGYEADRNEIFVLNGLNGSDLKASQVFLTTMANTGWDRSPQSICYTANGKSLLVMAEEVGAGKVFSISGTANTLWTVQGLTTSGFVGDFKPLPNGKIFISGSSIVDNSFYAIIEPTITAEGKADSITPIWTNSISGEGSKFGLDSKQLGHIWTPASNPKVVKEVHSIVVRPSSFDKKKKYPVAYLIHGGPQGAWGDSWSTRWNPAIFAEQGYIVVAPNPTGSTGYGQEFTDAIRKNWGGDPYQDIVNVFEWVGKNMPEADNDRAVGLGASYGGYMMNWIQGHDLGRKFKCLVCHDGITSFAGGLVTTEELFFPFHDLGGTPWYDPSHKPVAGAKSTAAQSHTNFGAASLEDWRKWDPSEHFKNWATPQLVIHSAKDYRLPISEGLAAFNVLQARGVDSQFLTFPDENHWVLKPENSLLWHKVVLNWINKYAGLDAYSTEDLDSDEFYGGVKEDADIVAELPTQGKVEM